MAPMLCVSLGRDVCECVFAQAGFGLAALQQGLAVLRLASDVWRHLMGTLYDL